MGRAENAETAKAKKIGEPLLTLTKASAQITVSEYFEWPAIGTNTNWTQFGLAQKEQLDSAIGFNAKPARPAVPPPGNQANTAYKIEFLRLEGKQLPVELPAFSRYNRQAGLEFDRLIRNEVLNLHS